MSGTESGTVNGYLYSGGQWQKKNEISDKHVMSMSGPVVGYGDYVTEYGSRLIVEVIDVKTGKKKSVPLSVNENYSSKTTSNSTETLILSEAPVIDMTN